MKQQVGAPGRKPGDYNRNRKHSRQCLACAGTGQG